VGQIIDSEDKNANARIVNNYGGSDRAMLLGVQA